jgi:hypothetical protein
MAATLVLSVIGWLVVTVGRGQALDDLCVTRPEAARLPEGTTIRGPESVGPLSFRCEAADPRYSFGFTDPVPFLGTCLVLAVVVSVGALVWWWAMDLWGAVTTR